MTFSCLAGSNSIEALTNKATDQIVNIKHDRTNRDITLLKVKQFHFVVYRNQTSWINLITMPLLPEALIQRKKNS